MGCDKAAAFYAVLRGGSDAGFARVWGVMRDLMGGVFEWGFQKVYYVQGDCLSSFLRRSLPGRQSLFFELRSFFGAMDCILQHPPTRIGQEADCGLHAVVPPLRTSHTAGSCSASAERLPRLAMAMHAGRHAELRSARAAVEVRSP